MVRHIKTMSIKLILHCHENSEKEQNEMLKDFVKETEIELGL